MAEEEKETGTTGKWIRRITDSLSGEPRDLNELIKMLEAAAEREIIDGDALDMLEGVLEVAALQVRDIKIGRAHV